MFGSFRDLELNLDLEDQTPVQKNYVAVSKPLYPEVKAYIEDFLNRDFMRKSSSFVSEEGSKFAAMRGLQSFEEENAT